MTIPDLLRRDDLTGLVNINAADLNNLIDYASPAADKSINLWTQDSALNTPVVPNPTINADYTKFKRYIWIRIPHASAVDPSPWLYVWNDSATIGTLLKWLIVTGSVSGLSALITAAQNSATDAMNAANAVQQNLNATNGTVLQHTASIALLNSKQPIVRYSSLFDFNFNASGAGTLIEWNPNMGNIIPHMIRWVIKLGIDNAGYKANDELDVSQFSFIPSGQTFPVPVFQTSFDATGYKCTCTTARPDQGAFSAAYMSALQKTNGNATPGLLLLLAGVKAKLKCYAMYFPTAILS